MVGPLRTELNYRSWDRMDPGHLYPSKRYHASRSAVPSTAVYNYLGWVPAIWGCFVTIHLIPCSAQWTGHSYCKDVLGYAVNIS